MSPEPQPQLAEAFLTALDEGAATWCFQTFGDAAPDKRLTRVVHGTLDQHAGTLADLNYRGAGVFVAVNETNGEGRRKADIVRIRALFVDLDGAPLMPVMKARPRPHIVTETSPGRFHSYWRVTDCGINDAEPALRQLVQRFDADKACVDRSRVMRLPGFVHRKRDPHLVTVIEHEPGECSLADFGFASEPPTPADRHLHKNTQDDISHLESSCVGIPPSCIPGIEGQRNKCLFALARWLKGTMPSASRAELRSIVEQWHQLALPAIGTKEFSTSWVDFMRGWDKVKCPHGAVLAGILEGVDMVEIPENMRALRYGEKSLQLVRICKLLQANAGDEPFFISARQAGELVGLHFTDASKVLYAFVIDGVLERVEKGVGRKASLYRYIWSE